jgi:hypothetical protein
LEFTQTLSLYWLMMFPIDLREWKYQLKILKQMQLRSW